MYNIMNTNLQTIESKEPDSFVSHHCRNSGPLDDTLDFLSIKLNVDKTLTVYTKLKMDLDFVASFCHPEDDETLPTRLIFFCDVVCNLFNFNTNDLKVSQNDATLVLGEVLMHCNCIVNN